MQNSLYGLIKGLRIHLICLLCFDINIDIINQLWYDRSVSDRGFTSFFVNQCLFSELNQQFVMVKVGKIKLKDYFA